MAFNIDKTLLIRDSPFQRGIELSILEKAEIYLQTQLHNPNIKLFSVNYKEIKSPKPGTRAFHVTCGYNHKDK